MINDVNETQNTNQRLTDCRDHWSFEKTVYNGGGGTDKLTKIRNDRRQVRFLLDALGSVNQEVVIELVDEKPTDEMISALERFWEKVFVELLPSEEGSSVKAKRMRQHPL